MRCGATRCGALRVFAGGILFFAASEICESFESVQTCDGLSWMAAYGSQPDHVSYIPPGGEGHVHSANVFLLAVMDGGANAHVFRMKVVKTLTCRSPRNLGLVFSPAGLDMSLECGTIQQHNTRLCGYDRPISIARKGLNFRGAFCCIAR